MINKGLLFFIIIISVGITIGFFVYMDNPLKDSNVPIVNSVNTSPAHAYKQPEASIEHIRVKAFYVVPQDTLPVPNWKEILELELKQIQEFHNDQFGSASLIVYDIYPEIINLQQANNAYFSQELVVSSFSMESSKTSVKIAEEIARRAFHSNEDIYSSDFATFNKDDYPILGIFFEGEGAWGAAIVEDNKKNIDEKDIAKQYEWPLSQVHKVDIEAVDGFFVVGRTSKAYQVGKSSIFYHEFAHALGLPDAYNFETPTNDIMGSGLYRPLHINYIDPSLLKEMGVE